MNSAEILFRLAEQSAIFCWTEETEERKSSRITRPMVQDAIAEVFMLLESAPAIGNANTIGYVKFKKEIDKFLEGVK